jgi:hypothetical protein
MKEEVNSQNIPRATHEGILHIGDIEIRCAVLETGQRVLTQSDVMVALGRARQAKGRQYYDADVNMPAFLTAKNLKPFISSDLEVTSSQLVFKPLKGARAFGYSADLLPKVCGVFIDAKEANALNHMQVNIAEKCKILLRGFANIGITALVDEATGYQEIRDRQALQAILDKYLLKHYAAWAKRFPDEFYQQIFKLRGWQWRGMKVNRPGVVANYTKDLVYARLAPGVLEELERLNPIDEGRRPAKHHMWLTPDIGHPALQAHLNGVIAIMRGSTTWENAKRMIQRSYPKINTNLDLPFPDDDQSE